MAGADVYTQAAAPVFRLVEDMAFSAPQGAQELANQADQALSSFAQNLARQGINETAILPARYALAVLIDCTARQTDGLRLSTWSILARQRLFDGRDISVARIAEFQSSAHRLGAPYKAMAGFLDDVMGRVRAAQDHRQAPTNWWAATALGFGVFVLALTGYVGWLEYRFQNRLITAFEQEVGAIKLNVVAPDRVLTDDLAIGLTQLGDAKTRTGLAVTAAPLGRVVRLPGNLDAQTRANARYADAIATHVPKTLALMLEDVLATNGDGLKLYDALRAWAVLTGETPWEPHYLVSWVADQDAASGWQGLAIHAGALAQADPDLAPIDAQVMQQAIGFAAQTSEVDRAWLELRRMARATNMRPWIASAHIADLERMLVRRSGRPLSDPIPGLFTINGWRYARDFGIGLAVQNARRLAPQLLGDTTAPVNETPDKVQDRLHRETIAFWDQWLGDLRVRPFVDAETAIVVSGLMAQPQSPLTQLLQAAWVEMGGTDRSRRHAQQIQLGQAFGPVIQYIEQGDVAKLARLFSELNVALAAGPAQNGQDLMSLRQQANTLRVMQTAPPIIVKIAQDVLVQASATQTQNGAEALTTRWQQSVYPACHQALNGRYPFAEGPDADLRAVRDLLAPDGPLIGFFNANVAPLIDQSESPWRWKPQARFAGTNQETAAFFESALLASSALIDDAGRLQTSLTLSALAERGTTVFAIGGKGLAVRASGPPAVLQWPGPLPGQGMEVVFDDSGKNTSLAETGSWGLLRLLDRFRLRVRDNGRRVLVDLSSPEGRIFVEFDFEQELNPVSVRKYLRGLTCPARL